MDDDEESFPSELQERLSTFDDTLTQFEDIIKPLHTTPINQVQAEMSPLDKAKLELVGVYALNSLYWMYLNVNGENPKEHGIKQELDRVRSYMARVKEIQDKEKAPKVNKEASKRFVRSALWQQAQKSAEKDTNDSLSPAGSFKNPTSADQPCNSQSPMDDKPTASQDPPWKKSDHKSKSRYHYQRPKKTYERKYTI